MDGRGPLILFYNSLFNGGPDTPADCGTPCTFTTDADAYDLADAVVFHLPTLGGRSLPRKREGQLWLAWSMESRVMYPLLDDAEFMAQFDLTMTYERASDIWMPYFGPGTVPGLRREVTPRTASSPVVYLQSNPHDRCERLSYAAELMTVVRVDSFGRVHRNQTSRIAPGWRPRQELYSKYKFTLAFENSFAEDYVTEKLYEPLTAGSVPVYRGTEDVAELAPAPGCYIDARAFSSARELGTYLNHLDTHDDEYLAFHEWRARPFSASFQRHLALLREHPFCRLAKAVAVGSLR
jgi:Glycosyltransferase family 10 (fucosyltransferase) C-term/Fucosyltransferase, N-terminal